MNMYPGMQYPQSPQTVMPQQGGGYYPSYGGSQSYWPQQQMGYGQQGIKQFPPQSFMPNMPNMPSYGMATSMGPGMGGGMQPMGGMSGMGGMGMGMSGMGGMSCSMQSPMGMSNCQAIPNMQAPGLPPLFIGTRGGASAGEPKTLSKK